MIDNKKSCKRWCLQDFSNSPSWARTNNPTVNSRVLYHWAIEDYSLFSYALSHARSSIQLLPPQIPLSGAFMYLQNCIQATLPYSISPSLPFPFTGHALDRLVTVSSIHCCTSTSVLSTSSSSRGLTACAGISHLEGGFTLRCLQRLSPPGLATLPWPWLANRSTSGQSIPVLSY